jgi:subtilisin
VQVARYVLLPRHGLRWRAGQRAPVVAKDLASRVEDALPGPGSGAVLVSLPARRARALEESAQDLRVAPVLRYRPALHRPEIAAAPPAAARGAALDVLVVSALDGRPLPGAVVTAFTDVSQGLGARARTGSDGSARLLVGSAQVLERLYVHGALDHWTFVRRRVHVGRPLRLALQPIDHTAPDGLRFRYGTARTTTGRGVRVGLVDTGIDADHPHLVVTGGRNCVTGEDPTDHGSNGHEHGTHVAGIVAGRGHPPAGCRGVAPAAELMSYRVFGRGREEATNFAIAKAIDTAVSDRCDVVNLSLGGGPADAVVRAAIEEAHEAGVIVVAAAGNDGRGPVAFPADLPDVVAVSALGRTGTHPPSAAGSAERRGPYGRDGADFIAAFSNVGDIDVTAPGVAIVSTVPGGYLDLDGTSMACPAVTGTIARMLSGSRRLRSQPRGPERAATVLARLHRRARSLGFPSSLEGDGLAR